jgi:probable rRNA maturation factor
LSLDLTVSADVTLPAGVNEDSLRPLVAGALKTEGATGAWVIGLQFTDDPVIRDMHRQFMGLDSPTDIMTFPYEDDGFSSVEAPENGGDIVISVDTAALNASDAGWALENELQFLVLHGILHLLGWDDSDPDRRTRMLARQSDILEAWRVKTGIR